MTTAGFDAIKERKSLIQGADICVSNMILVILWI